MDRLVGDQGGACLEIWNNGLRYRVGEVSSVNQANLSHLLLRPSGLLGWAMAGLMTAFEREQLLKA
jgi:hypothetical protein